MKYLSGIIFTFLMLGLAYAGQAQEKARWQEMTDFHEVMSTTFHPAEEGNFNPIRERAGEMVDRAQAWKASPIPTGYNKKLTAQTLKRLVKQCKVVEKGVKAKKSDKEIMEMLTKAHDIFHDVVGKCRE